MYTVSMYTKFCQHIYMGMSEWPNFNGLFRTADSKVHSRAGVNYGFAIPIPIPAFSDFTIPIPIPELTIPIPIPELTIPIPIPVTGWNQYTASIHKQIIIVRLMVPYGTNTNNIMNKTQREYWYLNIHLSLVINIAVFVMTVLSHY